MLRRVQVMLLLEAQTQYVVFDTEAYFLACIDAKLRPEAESTVSLLEL